MKNWIFALCCFFSLQLAFCQQEKVIGLPKEEIEVKMKEVKPEYIKCKVINDSYNYLKYQDSEGEQTILCFLDKKDRCTSVKLMSHYVYLGDEIARLNAAYEKVEENKWKYSVNGENYIIELQKGQWFFSVIAKKME